MVVLVAMAPPATGPRVVASNPVGLPWLKYPLAAARGDDRLLLSTDDGQVQPSSPLSNYLFQAQGVFLVLVPRKIVVEVKGVVADDMDASETAAKGGAKAETVR